MKDRIGLDPRDKKYHTWSEVAGYYDKPRVFHNTFTTEAVAATTPARDISLIHSSYNDLLHKSVSINSWQRDRNRSQVVRKDTPSLTSTISRRKLQHNNFYQFLIYLSYYLKFAVRCSISRRRTSRPRLLRR